MQHWVEMGQRRRANNKTVLSRQIPVQSQQQKHKSIGYDSSIFIVNLED